MIPGLDFIITTISEKFSRPSLSEIIFKGGGYGDILNDKKNNIDNVTISMLRYEIKNLARK